MISETLIGNKETKITELKISENPYIEDEGAKALAKYFISYKKLEVL